MATSGKQPEKPYHIVFNELFEITEPTVGICGKDFLRTLRAHDTYTGPWLGNFKLYLQNTYGIKAAKLRKDEKRLNIYLGLKLKTKKEHASWLR